MSDFESTERAAEVPKLIKSGRDPRELWLLRWHGSQEEFLHRADGSMVTAVTAIRCGGRGDVSHISTARFELRFGNGKKD